MPKTYKEINEKIKKGQAVVVTAEEIIDIVEKEGIDEAYKKIDVVTTATFGAMCSSGCFLNFGHTKPKIRMTEAWLNDVRIYTSLAAVDAYLGATELQHNDPENRYFPGKFRYGGGHVIEDLVSGKDIQLFALSYGTDEYPKKELRTTININSLNQAIMVNPRNCYQNYNVALNAHKKRTIYTYMGQLKPNMENAVYSSAGQLSPLLNDPTYRTIGIGTKVWLAGAHGHIYAQGTQHTSSCARTKNKVPEEGAATLALTADMKRMNPEFVRGASIPGYGASLALGIGIAIPILDKEILKSTAVKDEDIYAPVIDYSKDYPERKSRIIKKVTYKELKSGKITINNKHVKTSSMSSYPKARKIAAILKKEIQEGKFLLNEPFEKLPPKQSFMQLETRGNENE